MMDRRLVGIRKTIEKKERFIWIILLFVLLFEYPSLMNSILDHFEAQVNELSHQLDKESTYL